MVQIYNTDLINEIKEGVKLQQLSDIVPTRLADTVLPVMEVNPKLLRRINIVIRKALSTSTTGTIYTTPADKDFYLSFIHMASSITTTSVITECSISITLESGLTSQIMEYPRDAGSANELIGNLTFTIPIKLKKGSIILLTNTFSAGTLSTVAIIGGYTVDNA